MADIIRPPVVVTKTQLDPYPIDLRTTTLPNGLQVLLTAPAPPILWAATQL